MTCHPPSTSGNGEGSQRFHVAGRRRLLLRQLSDSIATVAVGTSYPGRRYGGDGMLLVSRLWPRPPVEVVHAVRVKYSGKPRPFPVVVRDRLEVLLSGEELALAFGTPISPRWTVGSLALVSMFQVADALTDRQAALAVSDRLSWSYALGLRWEDPGFDPALLSGFRSRAAGPGPVHEVLDLFLTKLNAAGVMAGKERQLGSSPRFIAALKDLNRAGPGHGPGSIACDVCYVPFTTRVRVPSQVQARDRCPSCASTHGTGPAGKPGPEDPAEPLAVLTARERQIAVLVSNGRTNQQIARSLSLSPKTIESHMTRIFGKLGLCSRAQIAEMVGRVRSKELSHTS
ncbi:LuxR C-terminal-related transcriptional regulator [Streptomyces sp. NPDC057445]|uniref:LuxR C-terminal-related transcriptional regulator n=1 Tax=Streptomyces sp. NPDC057445 TaxID=3346136 RepID=UPI00367CBC95